MKKLLIFLVIVIGLLPLISAETIEVNVTYQKTQNADNQTLGVIFRTNEEVNLNTITKAGTSNHADCIVIDYASNVTIATGSFSGNDCSVTALLNKGQTYRFGVNSSVTRKTSAVNATVNNNPTFPMVTNLGNFTGGYYGDQRNLTDMTNLINSTIYDIVSVEMTRSGTVTELSYPHENGVFINETQWFNASVYSNDLYNLSNST